MGLIWDNDTISRSKKQEKELKYVWIFSIVFFGAIVYLLLSKFIMKEFIMLTFSSSLFAVSIYAYLNKITHFRIPEKLNEHNKNKIRILFIAVGAIFFYLTWIIILAKYYPFLENLVGAQFLISHFGL